MAINHTLEKTEVVAGRKGNSPSNPGPTANIEQNVRFPVPEEMLTEEAQLSGLKPDVEFGCKLLPTGRILSFIRTSS